MKQKIGIIFIIGVIALMGNWVGYGTPPQDALAGMLVVIAVYGRWTGYYNLLAIKTACSGLDLATRFIGYVPHFSWS